MNTINSKKEPGCCGSPNNECCLVEGIGCC